MTISIDDIGMVSIKNKFAEFALRFGLDLVDPIEQSRRNNKLFRGFCACSGAMQQTNWPAVFFVGTMKSDSSSQCVRSGPGLEPEN